MVARSSGSKRVKLSPLLEKQLSQKTGEGDASGELPTVDGPVGGADRLGDVKSRKRRRPVPTTASLASPHSSSSTTTTTSASTESKSSSLSDDTLRCKQAQPDGVNPPDGHPESSAESSHPPGFFSSVSFSSLEICDALKRAIVEMKHSSLTEIQAKTIPRMLQGKDVLAAAQTGSGKTIAFLLPAMEMLYSIKFLPRNGCGCMVVSPTRELALQIYDVARELGQFLPQTTGLVIGGANRKIESDKLGKGVNLLVATPGRLLDHLHNTTSFLYKNLIILVIDEADRILEIGFEEEINAIVQLLPKKRQTALFSATQTTKVADLARLSLKRPVLIEVKAKYATVSGLQQGYVVCEADKRFLLLFTFLKKNRDKKIMIFFSTCMSVRFHDDLLNYIDFPTTSIHGKKKQSARMSTYYEFCAAKTGTLLCTDVAARGLDIPKVDWIIQYDPPDEPREYIHRVGRTARGAGGTGKALLFLMPGELGFLSYLKEASVPLHEYCFSTKKVANIDEPYERIIRCNHHLSHYSQEAYRAYIHAYASHSLKDIFNVNELDLQKVCRAFGFTVPPKVQFNFRNKMQKGGKKFR